MKYLHLLVAALYLLCAYWQINDPDWQVWVAAYGMVAYVAIRKFSGGLSPVIAFLPAVVLFAWWCVYVPAFLQWLGDGMPTITGSMSAENEYVELTREFFGLLICWGALVAYGFSARTRVRA